MDLLILARTLDILGKILLAVMALLVHDKIIEEKKIDKKILREMKVEKAVAYLAIIFLVMSYAIDLYIIG